MSDTSATDSDGAAGDSARKRPLEAPGWGQRIAGYVMILLGLLLSFVIVPVLLNTRDMAGGIAGGVILSILFFAGAACAFQHRVPQSLLKVFLLLMGVLAALIGVTTLGWVGYNLLVERQEEFRMHSLRALAVPVVFIVIGYWWIASFFRGAPPDNQP